MFQKVASGQPRFTIVVSKMQQHSVDVIVLLKPPNGDRAEVYAVT